MCCICSPPSLSSPLRSRRMPAGSLWTMLYIMYNISAGRDLVAPVSCSFHPPHVDRYVLEPISAALYGQKRLTFGLRMNIVREGLTWGSLSPAFLFRLGRTWLLTQPPLRS